MATADDVLNAARGEIGYDRYTDPEQGTKYGRWYAQDHGTYFGATGVPYCAMFTSWCFNQAGATCAGLPGASTTAIRNAARAAGALRDNPRNAQPGDVLLISWSADDNDLDHTCICEANCGSYVQTIEGNVNNGKVQRRTRDWKYIRYAVIPEFDEAETPMVPSAPAEEDDGFIDPAETILAYDNYMGPLSWKYVQWRLQAAGFYIRSHKTGEKLIVDGIRGGETNFWLMKYLRYVCGTYQRNCDENFSYYATCAIQQHLLNVGCYWYIGDDGRRHACEVDGKWGNYTTTAVQRAINAGVF